MKYKVLFYLGSSNPAGSGATAATFYRLSDAQNAASTWNELGGLHAACLWNGSSWTAYT